MNEIKFDLGKNVVDVARSSGIPEFAVRDIDGLVSYSVSGLPKEIPVRYTRPGFEVVWQPVFGIRMYADRKRDPGLPVQSVGLSLNIDRMSDAQAQAFAESTIAQFQKGRWQRYANPDSAVMLSGRSSVLDETGKLDPSATGSPDPNYKVPPSEWPELAKSLYFSWLGDGVLATYAVNNSSGNDGKPAYRMSIDFDLLAAKMQRDAENLSSRLKEGDAKGWNSSAEHQANKVRRAEQIKRLMKNAVARGDTVIVNAAQ